MDVTEICVECLAVLMTKTQSKTHRAYSKHSSCLCAAVIHSKSSLISYQKSNPAVCRCLQIFVFQLKTEQGRMPYSGKIVGSRLTGKNKNKSYIKRT